MIELLHARDIEKGFGDRLVLRGASLTVHAGERVGLVGVNGSGKSTFVRILAGLLEPDHGDVVVRGRLACMDQDPVLPGETVNDALEDGIAWHARLVADFEGALENGDMAGATVLQGRLDDVGWEVGHRVEALCTRIGTPPRSATVASLSGGERRRVALVRALLDAPDVLLLDEPTNPLDADAVEWLQGWLAAYKGAVLLVTHDRYLLEAVATRIVEVEDGETESYDGSYTDYLLERAERRASLERSEDSRLSMIAREAEWASRSPAAQTVKQKARLDRLAALMAVRPLRKEEAFSLDLRTGLKHGGTVLELHRAKVSRGGRVLFTDVELALRGGDRIGILGPNGAGKSTMLKILHGQEVLDSGEFVRGSRVRAAVLDQNRTGLNLEDTVWEAAGGGNDQVRVGENWIHVASFLGRFLFNREAHGRRVKDLSGGERARLLLAKLLLQGANLIMLDEPTNDLDLQTLRVLEEALLSYDGVVIVVTHDRAFLDRVCNAVIAFEPGGVVTRYASRQQALAAQARREAEGRASAAAPKATAPKVLAPAQTPGSGADGRIRNDSVRTPGPSQPSASKKLSFKEQKELTDIPARIDVLEKDQARFAARLADSTTYRDGTDITALSKQLADTVAALEAAMERWAVLASRS